MNEETFNACWAKTQNEFKEQSDPTQYSCWFKPLKPIYHDDERIVLEVENFFTRSVLNNRYLSYISNAIQLGFGREFRVELVGSADEITPAEAEVEESIFNPKYTFDTFVVGNGNRFAHAASLAVAEKPSDAYNPLFLYGGVGLGKTHLMHAIGHFIHKHSPEKKLLYITSENFTNQLIDAISKKATQEMHDRFRNVDVLMVDDVQFIAGKVSTQEEFFHTFNELHSSGKQIILSSDRPPKEIPTLEERLRSRFEWGLIADIQKPDYETRVAILRRKAETEHISVENEVLHYIADKCESNIRELEGALTRVHAMASLVGDQINMEWAQRAMENISNMRRQRNITPDLIIDEVSTYYHVTAADMTSSRRNKEIALPRQVAMYLAREMTGLSTTRIGEAFKRDHTTVMHACEKIASIIEENERMRETIAEIKTAIRG